MGLNTSKNGEAVPESHHPDVLHFTRRKALQMFAVLAGMPDAAQRFLDGIKGSIGKLIEALDHDDFDIREGAQRMLGDAADKEVRAAMRPIKDAIVAASKHPLSPEQKRRLDELIERIRLKEQETILEIGAVVELPAAWQLPGHTETVERLIGEITKSSRMPLTMQHMSPVFRRTRVPTQGLSGKTFWEVLAKIRAPDGAHVDVTSRGYGQLFAHRMPKEEQWRYGIDGGVRAAVRIHHAWPQLAFVSLRGQPNAEVTAWDVERAVISYGGEELHPQEVLRRFDSEDDKLQIVLPSAPKPGMTANIELWCNVAGQEMKMESVTETGKEQFFGENNMVRYAPPVKLPDGGYMVAVEHREEARWPTMRNIGCTAYGADGLPLTPRALKQPPVIRPQRLEYTFDEEPKKVAVHTLSKQRVAARKRFVIKDVPLP